ncbi:CPBP family intramembrane glutamic endopeptidase [Poseidonocella sp. HB161398]|uniref:CPBP family intramembrane glutamic endopeptidase n=1 Tax=Poseidonocella sp. HB161398 TaxID=2320855 RepID=UPI0014871C87|nr:CPBP family intramembrane glutamic endopeptidase [Poseidonocella sp. HB161398]
MSSTLTGLWPDISVWMLLAAALAVGWTGRRAAAMPLLAAAMASGWWSGVLGGTALLLFATCLAAASRFAAIPARLRPAGHAALIIACLAFSLGLVPGLGRLPVAADVLTGPQSVPFSYSLGTGKPLAFFLLLFALPGLLDRPQQRDALRTGAAAILLAALFALALAAGMIRWELSLPDWLPVFLAGNLLLTCLPEEAFFRGYLQRGLSGRLGPWPALAVSAALFGLAHAGGGPLLALFAGLAGLAYGAAFQFGGGLGCAVLFHFGFNLAHLLLFTYPAAAP